MTDDELDALILRNCTPEPRKVAFVVGLTLSDMARPGPEGIDDVYVARRVKALITARRLQGWGDLDQMRYSEVALPD